MVCLWTCAGTELWCFLSNAPQFGERAVFSWQKAPQCLGALQDGAVRRFTRRRAWALYKTAQCDAHGGREVAHITPCFQVPLRRVCCILCDVCTILTMGYINNDGTSDVEDLHTSHTAVAGMYVCTRMYVHGCDVLNCVFCCNFMVD